MGLLLMSALAAFERALASGVQLSVHDGRLVCRPSPEMLPQDLRDALREHKIELIALVSRPAAPAPEVLTKGGCYRCGSAVHWIGPSGGLVNWLGQAVHLQCPMSRPEPPEARPEIEQPDPDQFDEAGYDAMRKDIVTATQDLTRERKGVGQICRMFGLKRDEVWTILRGDYDDE
jgi:hypothetical protein